MIDKNKEFTCSMDLRVKPEDDRRGVNPRGGDARSGSGMTSARGESGRSMVEMLGTLAIIGVLSVGAIAGYRYAMDNYYTNEILAGASQRAVLVAAQIASGREASLKEFSKMNDTAGGTFDSAVTEWDGEFGIQVTKVNESVCKNLIKATEDTDIIITDTDGVDLAESDCSGDNNTFLFVYSNDMGKGEEDTDPACVNVTCDDGLTCVNGSCLCSDGTLPCNGECCASNEFCTAPGSTSGECKELTCDEADEDCCVTNADCGKDEFCLFESYTSATDAETTCPVPANGVCTALTGSYAKKVVEDPKEPLYGVTYSDATMNWWSASNWCQANGSSLMTRATLNTLSGGSSADARKTALQGGLGKTGGDVWLEDAYSSTSCTARSVIFSNGGVNPRGERYSMRYALCR